MTRSRIQYHGPGTPLGDSRRVRYVPNGRDHADTVTAAVMDHPPRTVVIYADRVVAREAFVT